MSEALNSVPGAGEEALEFDRDAERELAREFDRDFGLFFEVEEDILSLQECNNAKIAFVPTHPLPKYLLQP